jgi:hypothetical protein
MNVNRDKLKRVRRILGTKTDTEAVEKALDVVLANSEIESAIDAVFGQFPDIKVI